MKAGKGDGRREEGRERVSRGRGREREREIYGDDGGAEREGQQPVELNTFVPEPDNGLRNSITRTAS